MITTKEAARRLLITPRRIRVLITTGRLPATPMGIHPRITWLIDPADLALVATRPPGRPKNDTR